MLACLHTGTLHLPVSTISPVHPRSPTVACRRLRPSQLLAPTLPYPLWLAHRPPCHPAIVANTPLPVMVCPSTVPPCCHSQHSLACCGLPVHRRAIPLSWLAVATPWHAPVMACHSHTPSSVVVCPSTALPPCHHGQHSLAPCHPHHRSFRHQARVHLTDDLLMLLSLPSGSGNRFAREDVVPRFWHACGGDDGCVLARACIRSCFGVRVAGLRRRTIVVTG
jgi:hypothetical protein